MELKVKEISIGAKIEKATEGAAAYDVFLPFSMCVYHGRNAMPLGIAIELPKGYEAKIEPRSGNSLRGLESSEGMKMDADVMMGKIDSDYRGEVKVLVNNRDVPFIYNAKKAIAQMTIYKVEEVEIVKVDELSKTERGEGGFGHTDKK